MALSAPLALHQVISVSAGGEVVIRLTGYDLDGDDLVATVLSVPASGTLHQASCKHDTTDLMLYYADFCSATEWDTAVSI